MAGGSNYAASATSGASSARRGPRLKVGESGEGGDGRDDLDPRRGSSVENAVFGVLFTLSKETSETRIVIRWALLKMLIDGWQLFTTIIQPAVQGWDINEDGMAWKMVSVLSFGWLADIGYGAYVALLYTAVALLAVNIGLCVWVAWCFSQQKFPVVWPIKVLRLFSSVFFQAFDIASLNLLQLGFSCRYTGPVTPHLHMALFPDKNCGSMPQIIHAVVSGVSLLIFILLALLTNMAEVEPNPKSRRPMALGHSGAEVATFVIKVLMTLTDVFLGWRKVAACVYLALSLLLAWQYLRWSPNMVGWVNHVKVAVSTAILWCAAMGVLLVFQPGVKSGGLAAWRHGMTVAMLAGIAPTMGLGAWASWLKERRTNAAALRAIQEASATGTPLQDLVEDLVTSPRDVEIFARCCRVWVDRHNLDKDAIARAQMVIKAGLSMFPGNAFVSLVQANHMIDVLGVGQSGRRQVEVAGKLDPGIVSRFIIFVRKQQAQQKAAGSTIGDSGGANMDLLGYVEYQRKQHMVLRLHREALQAMANFWKMLDSQTVSFTSLSKTLAKIDASVSQAQSAYRVVLETYGKNPRLVRLYGKFLETVKNDPWGAAEYFAEADRLEQAKNDDSKGPLLPDGTPLSRMDELPTAVLMMTSSGEIQMANKQAHSLFGYKKGDLDGKAVAALLVPQSTRRLSALLSALVERSLAALGSREEEADAAGGATERTVVLGMHRERMAFPLRVTLSKASGMGEDSTFVALLQPVPPGRNAARLWVTQNGVIAACDPAFVANFGFQSGDVVGAQLGAYLQCENGSPGGGRASEHDLVLGPTVDVAWDSEAAWGAGDTALSTGGEAATMLDRLLAMTTSDKVGAADGSTSCSCLMTHRYSAPLAACATVRAINLGDSPLYEVTARFTSSEPLLMLVADNKGAIKFASPPLASLLCPRSAHGALAAGTAGAEGAGADGPQAAHLSSSHLITNYTLQDFLAPPWKDMHSKFLKSVGGAPSRMRSQWSCRRPGAQGPTLELRNIRGQPLHMHVSVHGAEGSAGEALHVVRLARSSTEAAVAERRLRLVVSLEGKVSAVVGLEAHEEPLFGFDPNQVVGSPLVDVVEGLQQQLLAGGQRDGSAPPLAAASSRRSRVGQQSDGAAFQSMLQRVLAAPEGSSWRVTVMPPLAAAKSSNALALRAELLATQRAARALPAVAQLQLVTDEASSQLLVDLYPLQALSGVLELDATGRVASVLEERTRPVGLLFGVDMAAMLNQQLRSWVALPAGCSSFADLLSASGAKKSSLKHTKKDPPVKVGHVHMLSATHADGKPLQLDVQVVGKPGTPSVTVLLRPHVQPMLPAAAAAISPVMPPATVSTGVRMSSTLAAADGDADPPKTADKRPLLLALMQGGSRAGTPAGGAPGTPKRISRVPSTPDTPPVPGPALMSVPTHGSGESGSGAGPQLPPPPVPEALGLGFDLPLPGVVNASRRADEKTAGTAAAADTGGSAEATVPGASDDAVRPKSAAVLKMEASMRNNSLDRQLTEMGLGAAVDADSVDGATQEQDPQQQPAEPPSPNAKTTAAAADGGVLGAKASGRGVESAAESGDESDDAAAGGSNSGSDDGVKAVAPKNMDRISTWVVSKGEVYQNQAPAGAWGAAGSNADGLADVDADEGPLPERKGFMPAAGKVAAAGGSSGKWVAAEPRKGAGGALAAPVPMEAREDDAMSDGGQSAMSGVSAASTGAEYKRGKRFRNLVKLMDSGAAEQILRRFRYGALLTGAVLAVSHIICFVLVVTSIKDQQHAMTQLVVAGRAQLYLARVLVTVRALDLIYKGRAPSNLYSVDDAKGFTENIITYAEGVKELNNQVMGENRAQPIIQSHYYFTSVRVWSDVNTTSGEDVFENITLWDMATKVFMSAKDIYQNHNDWAAAGVNISSTPSGQFLLKSGESFFSGHRAVMDSLLTIAMEDTQQVNTLQLAFLIAEGCGVSLLAAALLTYLLRRLAVQRYTLYGTFLAIPVGLTRALTSQITNSLHLEDDEDEDGDDDEAQKAALSADPKQKRRATVDMSAGAGGAATGDAGGKDAADPLSPTGRGGALLRRQTTTMETPSRGGWLANCLFCVCFRNPKVIPRSVSTTDAWGDGGAGAGAGADATAAKASKRTLKRDSHDTLMLLTPFMLWSTLVFIFYAVSVAELKNVDPLVAMASVSNFNTARTYRACFYAQELAAEEDPAMLPTRRAGLYRLANSAKMAFYTLQLGEDTYKALGPTTERFPRATSGLSYESPEMAHLFYSNEECLRAAPTPPCPGPEYRFYEATHAGLDSIQQVYLSNAFALANDLSNNTVGLNNSRFDFMYNVGTKDLTDANIKVGLLHFDHIQRTFSSILMLHVLLFVMLWVCLAGFLLLLLNPLVKRYKKEKRRIAELMSQLPMELDVEKLVGRALGAAGNTSDALVQNGVTAAAADQGHSDAAKAWKNVLRSAASTAAGARGAKGELAARENSLRQDARRSSSLIRP